MNHNSRIYVAGHTGLVGSALVRRLQALRFRNLILQTHNELDLTNQLAVRKFFVEERPEYVFMAAAKVGGILANSNFPAQFICENVQIATNVIHEAYNSGVERLLLLGSSCVYPRNAPQPIEEVCLLSGSLESSNRAYALAKIAGIEMCCAYNRQYRTRFLVAMPANLYGPNDHYDVNCSHVIPALVRKMHEAKLKNEDHVSIWGTGLPRREFLYSEDAAEACLFLMNLPEKELKPIIDSAELWPIVNVGWGIDLTVRELAETIAKVVGFRGSLAFDSSKPDGAPRKVLSTERLTNMGWKPSTRLLEGLIRTYQDFLHQLSLACHDIVP